MTQKHHTHRFTRTEEAITLSFCLIDDAYANLNRPEFPRTRYAGNFLAEAGPMPGVQDWG